MEARAETGTSGTAPGPEALADYLRRVRSGVESGLDPLSAAERAASGLLGSVRGSIEAMARRLRGEHHEDEWGFDEEFAEAAFPAFEFLYDVWWRSPPPGCRTFPRTGARCSSPTTPARCFRSTPR